MKRIDLTRLQSRFIDLVTDYTNKNEISQGQLAAITGINRPRVNALLNNGAPLSAYYLFRFIREGIVKVADIKPDQVENKREVDFWESAPRAENEGLLRKIVKARAMGIAFEPILDGILVSQNGNGVHFGTLNQQKRRGIIMSFVSALGGQGTVTIGGARWRRKCGSKKGTGSTS